MMQLADVTRHQSHPILVVTTRRRQTMLPSEWKIMLMRSTLTMIVIWEWWKITCVRVREMREIFIMEFYNSIKTSFIAPRLDSRALQHFRYYLKMHPLSVSCFNIFSFAHTGCVSLSCYLIQLVHMRTTRWKSAINSEQLSSLDCVCTMSRTRRTTYIEWSKRVQQRFCRWKFPPLLSSSIHSSMDIRFQWERRSTNGLPWPSWSRQNKPQKGFKLSLCVD